jgi:hypothetical protein
VTRALKKQINRQDAKSAKARGEQRKDRKKEMIQRTSCCFDFSQFFSPPILALLVFWRLLL